MICNMNKEMHVHIASANSDDPDQSLHPHCESQNKDPDHS